MCRNSIRKGKNVERGVTGGTTGEYVNPRSRPVGKLKVYGSGTGGRD